MIWLTHEQQADMSAHASACLPEEACGLIGGINTEARQILAVTNQLHSPVRFRMDPAEQLHAFQAFEKAGLELIGIFHSHPKGPATPSASDIAEYQYPGVLALILSPGEGGWTIRAFEMLPHSFHEVQIRAADRRRGDTETQSPTG